MGRSAPDSKNRFVKMCTRLGKKGYDKGLLRRAMRGGDGTRLAKGTTRLEGDRKLFRTKQKLFGPHTFPLAASRLWYIVLRSVFILCGGGNSFWEKLWSRLFFVIRGFVQLDQFVVAKTNFCCELTSTGDFQLYSATSLLFPEQSNFGDFLCYSWLHSG